MIVTGIIFLQLHMAAAHGYADLAKFLLKSNCDPNCKDDGGWTPLHAAAYWSQVL